MTKRTLSAAALQRESDERARAYFAALGQEYLDKMPATVPPGKALVHNFVRPTRRLGVNGFRAWFVDANDSRHSSRVECTCRWAPELGTHYLPRARPTLSDERAVET
jgi:hypothetical protein